MCREHSHPAISHLQLQSHYGLQTDFPIQWLADRQSPHCFRGKLSGRRAAWIQTCCIAWPFQSAVLGLLAGKPSMLELHDFPAGRFGPLWLRLFLIFPGRKRCLPITDALRRALHLPEEQTVIAPDGVDIERYRDLPDAQFCPPST